MSSKAPSVSLKAGVLRSSDYVISVKYPTQDNNTPTEKAQTDLKQLISRLKSIGFYSQARAGTGETLLIFVKADDSVLFKAIKSLILKDYLYGLTSEITDDAQIPEVLTHVERLSVVYQLLTNHESEGGAAITPGVGSWAFVEKIIPIHDYRENKVLLKNWLIKPLVGEDDILKVKEIAGEKVALYFGFLRFYFLWLTIPTVLGLVSHFFFKRFSIIFTILNSLWAIVFVNAWKKKEAIYAVQWNTRGSSKIEARRAEFIGEIPITDATTGLATTYFPEYKRTLRKFTFIPIAVISGAAYFSFQILCFFIEIFLTEIYQGPGKFVLGLVPTVLIVVGGPIITSVYQKFIDSAVQWENHETQSSYDSSVTEKLFVHNFLGSYVPLLITVFAYFPFGHIINDYLPFIHGYTSRFHIPVVQEKYQINSTRLLVQFEFFTKTALIVSFLLENAVPVSIRLGKEYLAKKKTDYTALNDAPEETEFLKEIRKQISLPVFDVNAEYRELAINFGYLVIFGPVWSLAPLFSLISNYVEIKGDLEKLLAESSRPIPAKAETIDPWNTNFRLLTWVGSLVGPVTTVFFRQQDNYLKSAAYNYSQSSINIPGWKAASVALISENVSIVLNVIVERLFDSFTTKVEEEYTAKSLHLRRSYVESYVKQTSIENKNIVLDPASATWSRFNGDLLLRQASTIPVYLKEAKDAQISIEKSTKSKGESDKTSAPTQSSVTGTTSSSQRFTDNSNLQSRADKNATSASKVIPGTKAPVDITTPIVQTTTDSAVSAPQKQVSTDTPRESGSGHTTGAATSGLSSSSGPKDTSSESKNATSAAQPTSLVNDSKDSLSDVDSKAGKKKKKGLFGFGKKETKAVGKALKEDVLKNADQLLKKVGKDAANDDFSTSKQLAKDATANPEKYANNTKETIDALKNDDSAGTDVARALSQISSESIKTPAAPAGNPAEGPSKSAHSTTSASSAPKTNGQIGTPRSSTVGSNYESRRSDHKSGALTPDKLILKNSRFASDGVSSKALPPKAASNGDSKKHNIEDKVPVVSVSDEANKPQAQAQALETPSSNKTESAVAKENGAPSTIGAAVGTSAAVVGASVAAVGASVAAVGASVAAVGDSAAAAGGVLGTTSNASETANTTENNNLKAPVETSANLSQGSLNGATLPPNFGSKKSSTSSVEKTSDNTSIPVESTANAPEKRFSTGSALANAGTPIFGSSETKDQKQNNKNYSGQQTGYTGASDVDAFASQPQATLDKVATPPIPIPEVSDSDYSKSLDPGPGTKRSSVPISQQEDTNVASIKDSHPYNNSESINSHVQKGAEEADAQENNQISKNQTSTAPVKPITPKPPKIDNQNARFPGDSAAYSQFVNKAALGETAPRQPSLGVHSDDGESATSGSPRKIKRGLFGTIKHKVKSAGSSHSTPNKSH